MYGLKPVPFNRTNRAAINQRAVGVAGLCRIQWSLPQANRCRAIFRDLEQMQVRGFCRRIPRLEVFAWLVVALAMPVVAQAAENAQGEATQTQLSVATRDRDGHTKATLEVSVVGDDGLPATGAVTIEEDKEELAGAALHSDGHATLALDLAPGDHSLRAVYAGDAAHQGSKSEPEAVHAMAGSTPNFSISASPAKLTLPLGKSGAVVASITPINNSLLTAPMFVTLSCQGLPDESSCTFTPENVEILPTSCNGQKTSPCPVTSTMVVETQLGSTRLARPFLKPRTKAVEWALLIPGGLVLLGLGWRRDRLGSLSLLVLLGAICVLGATACNERYDYFNHGPPHNPPTPAGTYTLTISAQSTNGITAVNHTTTVVLTVQP
jgi:hypothetical protein